MSDLVRIAAPEISIHALREEGDAKSQTKHGGGS